MFPVPTGMNRVADTVDINVAGVPRAHGDEPSETDSLTINNECSPCPRG